MLKIDNELRASNPYYHAYKSVSQVYNEQLIKDQHNGTQWTQTVCLNFKLTKTDDPRRYNIPKTSGEIAIVFNVANGKPPINRAYSVHPKPENKKGRHTLSILSRLA